MLKILIAAIFALFCAQANAIEKPLFGFEDSEIGKFNVKRMDTKNCIRGHVTAFADSNNITLSVGKDRSVAAGTEFIVWRSGTYVADVKVTAVSTSTSTASRVGGTQTILAGDSLIQSYSVHNFVNSNYTLPIEYNCTWNLLKGNSSQGLSAFGLSRIKTLLEKPINTDNGFIVSPETWNDYGFFINGSTILNTCGIFRALFPKDWSGYDLLRIDVYAKDVSQGIRVAIEDEEIAPMAVRNYQVSSGQWVTLEFDLRKAVQERKLNLAKLTGLHVAVTDAPGKSLTEISCLIDNIRLAVAGEISSLPLIQDQSSFALPDYYKHNTTPKAEVMPNVVPDRSALVLDSSKLIYADTGLCFEITGFISAFDNNNMIAGFTKVIPGASPFIAGYTMSTNDGGNTWKGINGENIATRIQWTYPTESCGRGESFGNKGDVLLLTSYCTGGGHAGIRGISIIYSFDGLKWGHSPYRVVESDSRHCIAMHTAVKTPDGRLWSSFGKSTRLNTVGIDVHFSDDDGQSWKPSRQYTSGVIPVSNVIPSPDTNCRTGQWAYSPTTDHQTLVKWGTNTVACIMQTNAGYLQQPVYWSRLENGQWTAREEIPVPNWTNRYARTWPGLKAVSVNGNEMFLVHSCVNGVLHYKDGAWTREALDVPFNSSLCVAGGKYVMAVGATAPDSAGVSILTAWKYSGNGKWTAPIDVARGVISMPTGKTPAFYIPSVSPENFVPLVWTTSGTLGKNVVKFVRIPIDIGQSTVSESSQSAVVLQAALNVFPNPFSGFVNVRYGADAKVSVVDINGKCVWQSDLSGEKPNLTWDSSKFARGVYMLKLSYGDRKIKTVRMIKI